MKIHFDIYFTFLWLAFLLLLHHPTKSQDLTPELNVCPLNDVLYQAPTLPNATSYDWDFCTGDLLRTPTGILITDFINDTQTAFNDAWRPEGIDLAYDNGNWYGFIMNLFGKNLIRVDFGSSLSNPPIYTNLGIIGGASLYQTPRKIKLGKDLSGNWYGFINNAVGAGEAQGTFGPSIVRLSFGNSLTNIPSANILVNGSFWNGSHEIDLVLDNGELKLIVTSFPLGGVLTRFNVLNFGTSYENTPIVTSTDFSPRFFSWVGRAIQQDNNWYYLSFGRDTGVGVRLLNFGNSLSNTPVIEKKYNINPTFSASYAGEVLKDGKNIIAFVINDSGNLFRFNFGEDIRNEPTFTNLGNFGLLGTQQLANRPSLTMAMAKDNSQWHLFAINRHPNNVPPFDDNELVRIDFPDLCNVLPSGTSTEEAPTVQYLSQAAGSNYTNVSVLDAGGNVIQTFVDLVEVIPAVTGSFLVENQNDCEDLLQGEIGMLGTCAGEAVRFFNASNGLDANVNTWLWDFGDGNTSAELNPTHTYASQGAYAVSLTINNTNTACNNTVVRTVRLSPAPMTDFGLRSIDCETGKVVFEDLSQVPDNDANLGGFLTRRTWFFGDGTSFEAGRDDLDRNDVIVKGAREAGEEGQDQALSAYAPEGVYAVTLITGNDVCCTSAQTRSISLRAEDLTVSFSNDMPCVGSPIQFTDLSSLSSDVSGEIATWEWTFTSPSGNVLSNFNQNPLLTLNEAGTYSVALKVNSPFTCERTLTLPLEVMPSAVSDFTASANIGTAPLTVIFTNNSSAEAQTYLWNFDNGETSQVASPTYTFETPGIYQVTLQAKNANGCGTLVSREIRVLDDPTSLADDGSLDISVYPNPSQGVFFIESSQNALREVSIQVRDAQGNEVYQQKLDIFSGRVQVTLPEYLAAGLYFLQIESAGRIAQKKIVKVH